MRMITSDNKRTVDIGTKDILYSIYSTALSVFKMKRKGIADAIHFIETGQCSGKNGYTTARQFNLIRDAFAKIPPEKVVYDIRNKKKQAPWNGNISPVITSCANLFTTADGKDLLYEIVSILSYAQIVGTDVIIE